MILASGGPLPPIAGPPGPPESGSANFAPSLGFGAHAPAPVCRKTGARNRGQGIAA